jgi:hypothetical protein
MHDTTQNGGQFWIDRWGTSPTSSRNVRREIWSFINCCRRVRGTTLTRWCKVSGGFPELQRTLSQATLSPRSRWGQWSRPMRFLSERASVLRWLSRAALVMPCELAIRFGQSCSIAICRGESRHNQSIT